MANIVLGCDRNNSNDSTVQNTVAKILEKAGHKVEKLSIGPNFFAKYSYSNNAKGKIGIYLMAASLVSVVDLYGGNTQFKYAYFGIRGDASSLIKSEADLKTKKIPKDHHGDCTTALCQKWQGKTYAQINELAKSKCLVTAGSNGEELGNNLVKAMGGESITDGNSSDSSSSGGSTIKEAVQKLLKHWDGEVECYNRGENVYINKICDPSKYYSSILQEGVNVILDSINITDVNPDTINHLIVNWTGGSIEISDDVLIDRFGEKLQEIEAVKTKTTTDISSSSSTTDNGDDTNSSSSTNTTSSSTTTESITTEEEALEFANHEWCKIKRDNGHSIECQVMGNSRFRVGEWVKAIFPSFNINGYKYITRVSQSDDGGAWTGNLTLVDYPPGWGKEEEEEDTSSSDTESIDTSSEDSSSTDSTTS